MQVWPMATHHPYTRAFWQNREQWLKEHPGGIKHGQPEDFARYSEGLTDTDDFFERMVAQLKAQGLYENTVIIAVGDHGEAFGEHHKGNVFHGNNVYEESVHVAAFLHSPQLTKTQHESRFFSHKDLIASIRHLAGTKEQVVFNDARSIFNQYEHELPIYLYNSWSKYLGIIWQGQKLRYKDKPNAKMYFASIDAIKADPSAETREVRAGDDYQSHQQLLSEWEQAIKALTHRYLYTDKDYDKKSTFNDMLRIYCDDGKGFREGHKDSIVISQLLDNRLFLQPDKRCQALRLVFLQRYDFPKNKDMIAYLKQLEINGENIHIQQNELNIKGINAAEKINSVHFKLLGKSAAIDIKLSEEPVSLQEISLNIDFLESAKTP